ncbi:MAG: DUF4357 domain-containing protein [Parasphingorhabdus sp.]
MKGLLIRKRWLDLILDGQKTWEMRSRKTKVRGPIALIESGSGTVVGTAKLVDSLAPLKATNYMEHRNRHAIPEDMLDDVIANGWVHPWVLTEVQRLASPVSYDHPSGAVTFVNLDEQVTQKVKGAGNSFLFSNEKPDDVHIVAQKQISASNAILGDSSADSKEIPLFWFCPQDAEARGYPTEDGRFLVLKGSTAMRNGSPNVKRDVEYRDVLLRSGVLEIVQCDDLLKFAQDHVFPSASKAAGVIKDGNASGPSLWREHRSGRTLKDYLATLAQ